MNNADKSRKIFSELLETKDVEDIFELGSMEYCTLYQFKDERNTTDDQMNMLLASLEKHETSL